MTTRLDALTRLALSEATTEPGLQAKASALVRLAGAGDSCPVSTDRLRAELRAVVETEALSARGLAGVLQALRGLERLDEPAGVWPSETPDERAPDQYWPHEDAGAGDRMMALDACDTMGRRDRWRERVEGSPPWRGKARSRRG